jgi:hypothetical protein
MNEKMRISEKNMNKYTQNSKKDLTTDSSYNLLHQEPDMIHSTNILNDNQQPNFYSL